MGKRKDFGLLHNVFSKCDRDFSIVFRRTPLHSKFMSPANQLSSPRKVNFSGAFQWFCIGSSPWPHLWSFSRMTITDYFIKERSDQKLSAILSCGRQFVVSYIGYVLRNWRAQSFLSACRRLLFPLLHACNKGNRRRLHAGKVVSVRRAPPIVLNQGHPTRM